MKVEPITRLDHLRRAIETGTLIGRIFDSRHIRGMYGVYCKRGRRLGKIIGRHGTALRIKWVDARRRTLLSTSEEVNSKRILLLFSKQ